ncbi:Scr1 family TA system antitoxin-like transcriptional regulator [Streptomyces sp. TRM 70351]|uniref:Scr1 family TA system antitoxin-like transcriptional regulator n=1 Tax=Streptomyces sp. TRM 70351 TaxID=3116552 RepID=UPI002E7B2B50|nr:Scr1 family TA system antitoxin-like transcriptional regulator [Streptomyces sp. TRM 70351]MEE1930677.1 Scr1 family TA system antitoxin-like transcriptional regulator [Streptomyces sp. TRM 70351]
MFDLLPPPTEVPQAPARIVAGVYLRGLREAKGVTQQDAARVAGAPVSALSRWERAQSSIPLGALRTLLRHFGVTGEHADYLALHLPPQNYVRREREEQGFARRAPHDHWADVAGSEAAARYIAVMRMASTIVEFCTLVPAGLRTPAYQAVVLDPADGLDPDEPVLGLPPWVHRMEWAGGQQRTVLLDEAVLARPLGGPEVLAGQLRHLADLMSAERADGGGLVIRVLPLDRALFIHTVSSPAEVTVHGHRLVTNRGISFGYETGSGAAHIMSAGLREAVSAAYSRERTYDLIVASAQAMERRAAS